MKIDYSSILKTDRVQPDFVANRSILTESESDLGKVLFSPAFRRLQQHAQVFPLNASTRARSKLSHAIEVAHVGCSIAKQIAIRLESVSLATGIECAAMINITEAACLARDVGSPPFGRAGEAAIQSWFGEFGPGKVRAACRTHGGREIDAADPRLLNALADFYEFDRHPQRLRALAKLQWGNDARGLNLTKASIACTLKYLRMAGVKTGATTGRLYDKPGFFSTEAGLVKNVWSSFAYDLDPQRFPLSYIVDAANDIVAGISDLEEAIIAEFLPQQEAIDAIKNDWLSTYIPIDPDPADERILNALTAASDGKSGAGADFSFADLRRALIAAFCDYAARRYFDQHEAVFAGTPDTLLPIESGAGSILATLTKYCRQHVYCLESVQRYELIGYSVIHGLLGHFGVLLECAKERFQIVLDQSVEPETSGKSLYLERKLLALVPAEYCRAYSHVIAQLGNGRDAEFEEWNARAHLLVDCVAGMTELGASETFKTLSGINP